MLNRLFYSKLKSEDVRPYREINPETNMNQKLNKVIICVYTLSEYESLELKVNKKVFILGDLNVKKRSWHGVVVGYGEQKLNVNGQFLIKTKALV